MFFRGVVFCLFFSYLLWKRDGFPFTPRRKCESPQNTRKHIRAISDSYVNSYLKVQPAHRIQSYFFFSGFSRGPGEKGPVSQRGALYVGIHFDCSRGGVRFNPGASYFQGSICPPIQIARVLSRG